MRANWEVGIRNVEGADASSGSPYARDSAFRNPRSPFPTSRRALTLVELLITMTILAILGAAILGTASAAMEAGRRSKTQTTINKIHGLIMERWASYETRRVPIHQNIITAINGLPGNVRGMILADARLLALRELMKKEMPDRWEDVLHVPQVLQQAPPLAQSYFLRYQQASSHPEIGANESAECLYMVVMLATGDGEARTLFTKQEIGDVDDDGMPEILDGWGNPIDWIRWPAGVVSDLQPLSPDGSFTSLSARADHDPFDVYRRDIVGVSGPAIDQYPQVAGASSGMTFRSVYERNIRKRLNGDWSPLPARNTAFRLTPLIFSGGPDGGSSLNTSNDMADSNFPVLDPYVTFGDPIKVQEGEPARDGEFSFADNITNHLTDY
jgi:prepilin-type N-terminal cleavage/methylation domain-containing protein